MEQYAKAEEALPASVMQALEVVLGSVDSTNTKTSSTHTMHTSTNSHANSGDTHRSSSSGGLSPSPTMATNGVKAAYDFGMVAYIYSIVDKSHHSRKDQHDAFVSGIFDHLVKSLNKQQDELAGKIWAWRERQMKNWRWALGLPYLEP